MTNNFKLTLMSGVAAAAVTMMSAGTANATYGMLPHCVGTVKCGMGGAGSALAGAAVDAALNPALAGKMGNEYQINLGWFWADVHGTTTTGSTSTEMRSNADNFPNGSFGVNYKIDDTMSFNLSLVPGGGGASEWPSSRSDNFFVTESEDQNVKYEMVYLQPSVSYKYDDTSTYGVGAILSRATMDTDSAKGDFNPSGVENSKATFYGVGFQVGGVWQVTETSTAALNVRSPVWHQKADLYDSLVFTDPIDTPEQITAGIAFEATPSTTIAIDYKWVGWSNGNTIGNLPSAASTASRGFGWENQQIIMLGLEHDLDEALTLRAGVSTGNSPINEGAVLGNFLFPAIIETHITAGGSYALGNGIVLGASAYVTPRAKIYDDGTQFGASGSTGTKLDHQQYGFQLSFSNDF